MNDQHKSNLAKLALAIIKPYKGHTLNMSNYFGSVTDPEDVKNHKCGTTTCFAGYMPFVFQNEYKLSYLIHSNVFTIIGLRESTSKYRFLFGASWPNDRKQCAIRALMVLKDEMPNGFDQINDIYAQKRTLKSLREELKKFIIK